MSSNPFSTRHTRPGVLPFFFGDEQEAVGGILARLRASGYRGEIIGPHGTGKTTLLVHVLQSLRDAGQHVTLFTLRDGQRRLPSGWRQGGRESIFSTQESDAGNDRAIAKIDSRPLCDGLVAIDGYEQLGWLARWQLKRHCRRRECGLLVTSHAPTGLPTIYRTRSSMAVARSVVGQLLPPVSPAPSDDELAHLLDVFHGNLREVLFALYDRFEPPTPVEQPPPSH